MAALLLLSINSIYTAGKPPAAQAIKPAHLIDPIHAPTRDSLTSLVTHRVLIGTRIIRYVWCFKALQIAFDV